MPQLINVYPFGRYGRHVIFRGSRDQKKAALTFDDGPSEITSDVLEILNKNKVKGTFFVIGKKINKYSKAVKQIVEQGSEIGNHTYSHQRCIFISQKKLKMEILKTNIKLHKFGIDTKIFRPAHGRFGFNLISVLKKLNMKAVIWDTEPKDWQRPVYTKIVSKIINSIKSGSIICLHECTQELGVNRDLLATLRILIPAIKKRGYKLVTVSDLLSI